MDGNLSIFGDILDALRSIESKTDENTKAIMALDEKLTQTKEELRTEIAETKEELRTEIAETKEELRTEIAELRTEIAQTKAELRVEIKETKEDLINQTTELANDILDVMNRNNGPINLRLERLEIAVFNKSYAVHDDERNAYDFRKYFKR